MIVFRKPNLPPRRQKHVKSLTSSVKKAPNATACFWRNDLQILRASYKKIGDRFLGRQGVPEDV